ncbi:MAG TPA: carbamoyl phosphate synthase small subunit, partial [Clostridium sp.]|nr:carbamoyl phosphate synthase small subunit [Clostridium sp.]
DNVTATYINVNDGTIEGMKHKTLPIYSVQFHPETTTRSKDGNNIFNKFLSL